MSHINDLARDWLLTQVVAPAGTHLNDLWLQFFKENGATSNNFNTAAFQFLGLLGFTGALNDRWHAYWLGGGGGGPAALRDRGGNVIRDRAGNIINTRT